MSGLHQFTNAIYKCNLEVKAFYVTLMKCMHRLYQFITELNKSNIELISISLALLKCNNELI
jgi:hypothetical protein